MKADQQALLLSHLKTFLAHPFITNQGEEEHFNSFDQKRVDSIQDLKALIDGFLAGSINLQDFKLQHESKCREHPYWGFKGFSGQMQLNQYVNNLTGDDKESVLRTAIRVPVTEDEARRKIDALAQYIADRRAVSDNPRALPRATSTAYVLSYFWEIQELAKWPVCYNSTKKVLDEIGLSVDGQESDGESYLNFLNVMKEIWDLYQANVKEKITYPFWFVEHVLWNHFLTSSSPTGAASAQPPAKSEPKGPKTKGYVQLGGEWLPPVIADLNDLAFNKETAWSKQNGLKPEKAFETKLRMAFTLLGYEATELGQGKGRQPDGFAISINVPDGDYAIVYDAKAREKQFSVGTSDREMYEYIKRKGDELKRRRVNRSYFLIVSSEFDTSPTNLNLVKDVFRRTRIPIIMMKAVDLLFLIEEKLKDTDLTHERLEQLFLETGILTREKIIDILGIR